GRDDLPKDERFAANSNRNQNRDALKIELEGALAGHACAEIAKQLIEAGVPCGEVRTIDQVVADAHTLHREMVVDIDDYRGTGSPIKLSRTPASYRSKPPAFAQHTTDILEERMIDQGSYVAVLPGVNSSSAPKPDRS